MALTMNLYISEPESILQEINNKIKSISIKESISIKNVHDMIFLGKGNFGIVYKNKFNKNETNKTVIKFSFILKRLNEYFLKGEIIESSIENFITEFDNELTQIKEFSSLKSLFPDSITKIFDTKIILIENDIFPVNMCIMEYVDGINLNSFLDLIFTNMDYDRFYNFVHRCANMLITVNLLGYFHNDISLKNIMVKNMEIPVLIDYSFSKKISKLNLFPIECCILISQLKQYVELNEHVDKSKLKKLYDVHNAIYNINIKYGIYGTVFIERFIVGSEVFTYNDYSELPIISNDDIKTLFNIIGLLLV